MASSPCYFGERFFCLLLHPSGDGHFKAQVGLLSLDPSMDPDKCHASSQAMELRDHSSLPYLTLPEHDEPVAERNAYFCWICFNIVTHGGFVKDAGEWGTEIASILGLEDSSHGSVSQQRLEPAGAVKQP